MLKPCPFCGKTDTLIMADDWDDLAVFDVEPTSDNSFAITCDFNAGGCGAHGGYRKTPHEAEEAWNSRPDRVVEALYPSIETALNQYRCQYTRDDEGDGLPLADILSPGETIREGKEELIQLADCIYLEIKKALAAVGGEHE